MKNYSSSQFSPRSTKRLLAYTSAASVGAFALVQSSNAAIFFTDLSSNPLTADSPGDSFDIDFDGNGVTDAAVFINEATPTAVAGSRVNFVLNPNLGSVLTTAPNAYYVESFGQGDIININSNIAQIGIAHNEVGTDTFEDDGTNNFAGISFSIDDNSHFGWIELDVDDGANAGDVSFSILGYAYESTPSGAIAAGAVPEPSTYALGLGLLALGAAGLRARRRKTKA